MLRIYGASDDLVELEGVRNEEVDCYDKAVSVRVLNEAGSAGVRVTMRYADTHESCGWTAEVMQLEGDDWEPGPMPWPVTVRTANEDEPLPAYSVIVEIDCPDSVGVDWAVV